MLLMAFAVVTAYLGVSDLVAVGISSFALAVLVSWISNIATSHFVPVSLFLCFSLLRFFFSGV